MSKRKKLKTTVDCQPEYSFCKGWLQVRNGDLDTCRERLMAGLGIVTRSAFLNRLKGKIEPKISEKQIIESIFADYGVTEIWGSER